MAITNPLTFLQLNNWESYPLLQAMVGMLNSQQYKNHQLHKAY